MIAFAKFLLIVCFSNSITTIPTSFLFEKFVDNESKQKTSANLNERQVDNSDLLSEGTDLKKRESKEIGWRTPFDHQQDPRYSICRLLNITNLNSNFSPGHGGHEHGGHEHGGHEHGGHEHGGHEHDGPGHDGHEHDGPGHGGPGHGGPGHGGPGNGGPGNGGPRNGNPRDDDELDLLELRLSPGESSGSGSGSTNQKTFFRSRASSSETARSLENFIANFAKFIYSMYGKHNEYREAYRTEPSHSQSEKDNIDSVKRNDNEHNSPYLVREIADNRVLENMNQFGVQDMQLMDNYERQRRRSLPIQNIDQDNLHHNYRSSNNTKYLDGGQPVNLQDSYNNYIDLLNMLARLIP